MERKLSENYHSVTQVLSYFADTSWYTEESKIRGINVHAFCNELVTKYILADEATAISNQDSCKYSSYYQSFINWHKACQPLPLVAEERFVDSQRGFTGKPDFIGTMEGKKGVGLIDFKTSVHPQSQWHFQIAAYTHLAELSGLAIDWGASLSVRRDGKPAILEYVFAFNSMENKYLKALQKIFFSLLDIVKGRNSWKQ